MEAVTGRAEPRSAEELAFMMETSSRTADHLICASGADFGGGCPRPGDVVREGELVEPLPGCGKVRVTHVLHIAEEVRGRAHFRYRAEGVSSEVIGFDEFQAGPLWGAAMEAWGDGDPDPAQVGNARAEVSGDGARVTASIDAELQRRGWPRRPVGMFHDDVTVTLDSSGTVELSSESMGRRLECGARDLFDLVELGRKCRDAGVEFAGGRVTLPVTAA